MTVFVETTMDNTKLNQFEIVNYTTALTRLGYRKNLMETYKAVRDMVFDTHEESVEFFDNLILELNGTNDAESDSNTNPQVTKVSNF